MKPLRVMSRWILLAATLIGAASAQKVTLSGTLTSTNGLPASNFTINFTPTQWFFIAGTAVSINTMSSCATSTDGTVVGIPNPLTQTIVTAAFTGTLPASTYYTRYTWYTASAETLPSPETTTSLSATGALNVQYPAGGAPAGVLGMRVYIATTSGAETLQGSTTGAGTYVQNVPLVAGAALPSVNNSVCQQYANDAGWPTGTGYVTSLIDPYGNTTPGYPMTWQLLGPNTTIDLTRGLPYYRGMVIYPSPILASPYNHNPQSISGNLSLGSYYYQGGRIALGKNNPAYPVDAAGIINADGGFEFNGVGSTPGYCLVANVSGTFVPGACITSLPTFYYQTVQSATAAVVQRSALNFGPEFTLSDSVIPSRTTVDLTPVGTPGTYAFPSSITTNGFGQITALTSGSSTSSLVAGNGYTTMPNGVIFQWATGTGCSVDCSQTVSFPITFPHACLTVQTTNNDSVSTTNITKNWGVTSNCTTTGVLLTLQRRGDEGSFTASPIVFAVGW